MESRAARWNGDIGPPTRTSSINEKNFASNTATRHVNETHELDLPLRRFHGFELPDRTYYLSEGELSALGGLRYPDDDGWRNPDLFWPDRSWFAATDVDFWSLYVGGSTEFTSELSRRVNTSWEFVDRDRPLPIED